jgi:hypothetical protein
LLVSCTEETNIFFTLKSENSKEIAIMKTNKRLESIKT